MTQAGAVGPGASSGGAGGGEETAKKLKTELEEATVDNIMLRQRWIESEADTAPGGPDGGVQNTVGAAGTGARDTESAILKEQKLGKEERLKAEQAVRKRKSRLDLC